MRPKQIDNLIKRLEAQPSEHLDERIDVLLDSRPEIVSVRVWTGTKRSRIAGAVIAAIVVLAILIGVPLFNGDSNNVWARALENTRKIGDYTYRFTRTERSGDPERPNVTIQTDETWYVSADYGFRIESHLENGRDSARICYMLYDSNEIITIDPSTNEVHRRRAVEPFSRGTPRDMSLLLLEKGDYVELGTKTVDGRVLVGIASRRTHDPSVEADGVENRRQEIWFDRETKLPAIVQASFQVKSTGVSYELRQDGFEYGVEFPPDFFKPAIPEDYAPAGIYGLRLFAAITGGRYPSDLTMNAVEREIGGRTQVEEAIRTRSAPSGKFRYDDIERAVTLFAGNVRGRRDSAYYGNRVTASDANQVLMYWADPRRSYEVIWGDLRMETLSKEQLIEGCHAAGDRGCLADLLEKDDGTSLPLLATCLGDVGNVSDIPSLLRQADLQQGSATADLLRNAVETIHRRGEQRNPSSTLVLGRLFYANGRPVSNGCVHIGAAGVFADRDGYFVMTVPGGDPRVEQVGYGYRLSGANACLFRWTKADAPAYLTVILDWTCTVEGRVVDPAGKPLAGADVGLCPYLGEPTGLHWPDGIQAKSDAQGRFLFESVPIGLPLNLVVESPGTATGSLRVRIADLAPDQKRDLGDIAIHGSEK